MKKCPFVCEQAVDETECRHLLPTGRCVLVEVHFDNEHTLEQVAEHFGLTRERVRQIEEKAIVKLQRHLRIFGKNSGLEDYPVHPVSLGEQLDEVAE